MFGKKKTAKEQIRETKREVVRSQRDLDRIRLDLEKQEKKLIQEIKIGAQQGNQSGVKVLAKQLVLVRSQKEKMFQMRTTIGSVGMQTTTIASHLAMTSAIQSASKVMGSVNQKMSAEGVQATMMEFEKQSHRMNMSEEMIQDTLIDAFDDEDAQIEEEAVIDQVLAEVGIDLGSKMDEAPTHRLPAGDIATVSKEVPGQNVAYKS